MKGIPLAVKCNFTRPYRRALTEKSLFWGILHIALQTALHDAMLINNINKLLGHVLAMQVSPAEGNVSFERYASAGHALTVHHFTVGSMHRSALAQHHMAAVARWRHSCTHCKLAYYVHCHARCTLRAPICPGYL